MDTCKGCGAEIRWIRSSVNRRATPVDAEPVWIRRDTSGDVFLRADGSTVFGYKIGDAFDEDAEVAEVFESHFATCPVAGQFRNRQPRKRPSGYR